MADPIGYVNINTVAIFPIKFSPNKKRLIGAFEGIRGNSMLDVKVSLLFTVTLIELDRPNDLGPS